MEVIWHAHNAVISDRLRQRVLQALDKVGRRAPEVTRAEVRFEREATRCRVELSLRVHRKSLVAEGHGRYYGPALAQALEHLQQQLTRERRTARERASRLVRT